MKVMTKQELLVELKGDFGYFVEESGYLEENEKTELIKGINNTQSIEELNGYLLEVGYLDEGDFQHYLIPLLATQA